ncbi:MAG: dockerin type I domain-containing protein [Gemmataceae bacterium]
MLKNWTRKHSSLQLVSLEDRCVPSAAKLAILPDAPAPIVKSVIFGDGSAQRSMVRQMVVNFSEPVQLKGSAQEVFTLRSRKSDVALKAELPDGPTQSVTISFSGELTEAGSLKDGLYDLTISAAMVSVRGQAMDGNNDGRPGGEYRITGSAANGFYRLYGDSNGDAAVDQLDYLAFRNALGRSSTVFDIDGDGDVNQLDYLQFRSRIGASV